MDEKKDTERRLIAVFENSLKIKLLLFNILICMTSKLELVSVMFRVYLLIKKKQLGVTLSSASPRYHSHINLVD